MERLKSVISRKNLTNGILQQYDDGLVHFIKHQDSKESTPEGTRLLYDSIASLQKDVKSPILINLSGIKKMGTNCRSFLMNQLPNFSTSIAFVVDDEPVIKSQFAISSHLTKKTIPMKIFHSEKDALNWLSKSVKK